MDFKKLYFTLFNTLSDAVEQIDTTTMRWRGCR